ncbi:hypothetical protein [Mycobacterium sp.]|uniref:hypothetical protein n=1 Tax=Mycobacterium sp. TaxID=1785 RepID=UPI002D4B7ABB|nr:hypothetical protein [Mycobacterium sp.]HZA08665.1 hypothetical protein [Mycobacterium sp.]
MDYRITPDDRARFKRCRRQWDFASPHRRDLEPAEIPAAAMSASLKDALAVYYYPGTWDWQHGLKQSLVHKALERSLGEAAGTDALETGRALVDCYDAWASTVDDFAPVKINHDVDGLVPDPRDPERGLSTPNGFAVIYTCRVDLVAVDSADEYWVVRHQVVDDWQRLESLIRDEEAVAACWAWERDYMSMEIAGTIHNEVRVNGPLEVPSGAHPATTVHAVAQNEPSGGGRSIPQHRRASAISPPAGPGASVDSIEQRVAGVLRRTRIRRGRDEIAAVGAVLSAEAVDMIDAPAVYPTPAAHCSSCEFSSPCLALFQGADPEPLLSTHFRRRPAAARPEPRLGQSTWGFGRGAAPPPW